MNIDIEEAEVRKCGLHTAILLYGDGADSLAVRHPVIVDRSGSHLGAGAFVTEAFVTQLLEVCNRHPLTYVPPNVVAIAHHAVAWYEPAAVRTMYFTPTSDVAVGAFDAKLIPQPALLFMAASRRLHVFALAKDERPCGKTALYMAPYWNIFDTHEVCLGSMVLPPSITPSDTGAWTHAFFGSNFTHLSGKKRWQHRGTYAELLDDAIMAGTFDPAWLLPAKTTMENALCGR